MATRTLSLQKMGSYLKRHTLLPWTSWCWQDYTRKYCSRPPMAHRPRSPYRRRLRVLRLQEVRGTNIRQYRRKSVEPAASATGKPYI